MRIFLPILFLNLTVSIPLLAQPAVGQHKTDSAQVVYYKNLFDSLNNSNNDSAAFYLMKAITIVDKIPPGQWQTMETMRLANRLLKIGKVDLSEQYIVKALEQATSVDSLTVADAKERAGGYYIDRAQYAKALDYVEQALQLYQVQGNKAAQADCLLRIGAIFDDQGLYDKSLSYYFQADSIYQATQDTVGLGYLLNDVAITYAKQKDFSNAILYYKKALAIYRQMGDSVLVINTKINLGITYKNLGQYELAASLFDDALEFYKANWEPYALATIFHNYGELMSIQKKSKAALDYYQRSQAYAKEIDAHEVVVLNYCALGRLYYETGELEKSEQSCEASLSLARKSAMLETQRDVYKILADVYTKRKNYKSALEAHVNFAALNDSLLAEARTKQINRLQTQFAVNQKDAEISSLKHETALQQEKNEVQERLNKILTVGATGLALLAILLGLNFLQTRRLNRMLRTQKQMLLEQHEEIQAGQEELKSKNDALTQLNNEKDEIIAMVAHDLRSPLNQIKGLLYLIANSSAKELSPEHMEFLAMINNVTDTMKERINRMLNVEALNAGKVNLQLKKVRARDIIEPVARNFKEQADRKNIDLVFEANGEESFIEGDRNYLLQAYENLVSNAVKFSSPGKKIWLKLVSRDNVVQFRVRDQGPGISPQDQEQLFTKYQSLSARPTQGEDSTGLGLAIVKKYVEAMNGKVWCESMLGNGAEFIVEFARVA